MPTLEAPAQAAVHSGASLEQNLLAVLQSIAAELYGTIGLTVVDIPTGMSLATLNVRPGFDLSVAAAFNAEVVKQKQKALNALKLQGEVVHEVMVTLSTHVHIISMISPKLFLYYAGESGSTNIGLVRQIIGSHAEHMRRLMS